MKDTLATGAGARLRPDTLAGRLGAALGAFVLLATAAFLLVSHLRGRESALSEAAEELSVRTRLVAERIESALAARATLVSLWPGLEPAQDLAVDDLDKRLSRSLVRLAQATGPGAVALGITPDGRIVAASPTGWIGRRTGDLAWIGPLPPTSDSVALRLTDGPAGTTLVAAAPVEARGTGRALGWIVVASPWANVAASAAGQDGARMTVRDPAGRVVSRGDSVDVSPTALRRQAGIHPVAGLSLAVELETPQSVALRPLRERERRLPLLSLVVLLVTLPAALLLAHGTTAALRRLTAAAQGVAGGEPPDFGRVPPGAPREVRVLAGALQAMVRRLEESRAELSRQEGLAAMGTMAAGLAHELRSPLAVVRVSAEILTRRAEPGSRDEELTSFIMAEVDRLGRLVDDLLVFARPRPPEPTATDLAAIAARAARTLAPEAERAGVSLSAEGESVPLSADAEQLYQVMLNLTSNAIQASPQGASVVLATSVDGGRAVLEVRDAGKGISPENRERIWAPFFTTRPSGTGLGLAIVRRIVEAHGGIVSVDGRPGGGTVARVAIPVSTAEKPMSDDRSSAAEALR